MELPLTELGLNDTDAKEVRKIIQCNVKKYKNPDSNPFLNQEDLQCECLVKLSEYLNAGRCKVEYWVSSFAVACSNHIRSLLRRHLMQQKHVPKSYTYEFDHYTEQDIEEGVQIEVAERKAKGKRVTKKDIIKIRTKLAEIVEQDAIEHERSSITAFRKMNEQKSGVVIHMSAMTTESGATADEIMDLSDEFDTYGGVVEQVMMNEAVAHAESMMTAMEQVVYREMSNPSSGVHRVMAVQLARKNKAESFGDKKYLKMKYPPAVAEYFGLTRPRARHIFNRVEAIKKHVFHGHDLPEGFFDAKDAS